MRALFVAALALALVGFGQLSASAQSEQIFCGRILGYIAATATAPGAFVIVKPGDAPAPVGGTYIAITAGTQFQMPGTAWVCVRATPGGATVPVPGSPSGTTHTFVAFVPEGAPGYQPEPTATPSGTPVNICGRLTELTRPTQIATGFITVAGERFAISSGARQNISPAATVGSDVCLTGSWLMSQTVGRNLSDLTVVPRATGQLPSTATADEPTWPRGAGAVLFVTILTAAALVGLRRIRSASR